MTVRRRDISLCKHTSICADVFVHLHWVCCCRYSVSHGVSQHDRANSNVIKKLAEIKKSVINPTEVSKRAL